MFVLVHVALRIKLFLLSFIFLLKNNQFKSIKTRVIILNNCRNTNIICNVIDTNCHTSRSEIKIPVSANVNKNRCVFNSDDAY